MVNAAWVNDDIVVLHRTGEGGLAAKKFPAQYTCYLRASDVSNEDLRKLRDWKHIKALKREGSWWRLTWANWKVLRKACEKGGLFDRADIPTFEADLHPVRRFFTDNPIVIARPKRAYIDLETDSRKPIAQTIDGRSRILCWSIVNEHGEKIAGVLEEDTDEAERELLEDFWYELKSYEQVIAWGGDDFDFEVLKRRCWRLGMEVNLKRWLWLDHLTLFRRMNMSASESGDEKQSMALDSVSHAILGVGKAPVDAALSWEYWAAGGAKREELVRYCVRDTNLMRLIEEKTGFIDLHQKVCEVCTTLPDSRGVNPTNFVEGYLLKLARERDVHFKSKFSFDRNDIDQFEGAYVMEPARTGLIENVHVCDFASLYPSIIITWNISPETYRPDIKLRESAGSRPSYLSHLPLKEYPIPEGHCAALNDAVFTTEFTGVLPEALIRLLELRSVWKEKKNAEAPGTDKWKEADRRSSGYKIVANSCYGVMGSPFSRFYEPAIAEAVTVSGQWLLKKTIAAAEDRGYEGLYGDTDSCFIANVSREAFSAFVDWCNKELYPNLLNERRCMRNAIKLSYEKQFRRMIMVGKKRYAASFAHYEGKDATADSKPEIKGLEYKRGDTLRLARQFQHQVVSKLLYEDLDQEQYTALVGQWRQRILEHELELEDVVMSKRISKPLDEYKQRLKKDNTLSSRPAHVELAIELNKKGADIRPGQRIRYIVADASVSPMKVISDKDFDGNNFDRFYMWENLVYPPTQRVLEAVYPGKHWNSLLKARPRKTRARAPAKPKVDLRKNGSVLLPGFE